MYSTSQPVQDLHVQAKHHIHIQGHTYKDIRTRTHIQRYTYKYAPLMISLFAHIEQYFDSITVNTS